MTARTSRKPWILAAIAAATVVLGLILVGGWWLGRGLFDPQWNLTLTDVMASTPDAVDTTTNPVNVTSSVCDEAVPCVEAYDSAEALYLRFDSRAEAAEYEESIRDGFRSNYIVMDFAGKDEATKTQQLAAMQHLAGIWQDYVGEFPDR